MRVRGLVIGVVLVGVAWVLAPHALSELVTWQLRDTLATHGFPDARFRVVAVERDRIELAEVELAPGLALGSVEIDAGISLLWREPKVVSIRGAHVHAEVLARILERSGGDAVGVPVREIRISESTFDVGSTSFALSGHVALDGLDGDDTAATATASRWHLGGETLEDVRVTVSADRICGSAYRATTEVTACAPFAASSLAEVAMTWAMKDPTWNAKGDATLTFDAGVALDGHATLRIPAWSHDGVALEEVTIDAHLAGTIDAARGDAVVHASSARSNGVVVTELETELSLSLSNRTLSVRATKLDARHATTPTPAGPLELVRVTAEAPFVVELRGSRGTLTWTPPPKVAITAERGTIAGVSLLDASALLDRNAIAWRARSLTAGPVTALAPSGVATSKGVSWQAARVAVAQATLIRATGTLSLDRTISWRAQSGQWREILVDEPEGEVRGGDVELRAAAAQWGDLRIDAPRGRSRSGGFEMKAARGRWRDVELVALDARSSADVVTWRLGEVIRGADAVHQVTGTTHDATHSIAWRAGRSGHLAFGAGAIGLATSDGIRVERATVTAYGGQLTLANPTALDEPFVVDVRAVRLGALVSNVSSRAVADGVLDGRIVVRHGELESVKLASQRGAFRLGEPAWVEDAVARITAGQVAVTGRVGGALADFRYDRLGLVLQNGDALRVELRGVGRRVPQELDLIINIRGLRPAARVIGRTLEAT